MGRRRRPGHVMVGHINQAPPCVPPAVLVMEPHHPAPSPLPPAPPPPVLGVKLEVLVGGAHGGDEDGAPHLTLELLNTANLDGVTVLGRQKHADLLDLTGTT